MILILITAIHDANVTAYGTSSSFIMMRTMTEPNLPKDFKRFMDNGMKR